MICLSFYVNHNLIFFLRFCTLLTLHIAIRFLFFLFFATNYILILPIHLILSIELKLENQIYLRQINILSIFNSFFEYNKVGCFHIIFKDKENIIVIVIIKE